MAVKCLTELHLFVFFTKVPNELALTVLAENASLTTLPKMSACLLVSFNHLTLLFSLEHVSLSKKSYYFILYFFTVYFSLCFWGKPVFHFTVSPIFVYVILSTSAIHLSVLQVQTVMPLFHEVFVISLTFPGWRRSFLTSKFVWPVGFQKQWYIRIIWGNSKIQIPKESFIK